MEKVEIRFRASAMNENQNTHYTVITLHIVKSGNNRFIADFDNLNAAVKYASK